jgi:hypothetical protein
MFMLLDFRGSWATLKNVMDYIVEIISHVFCISRIWFCQPYLIQSCTLSNNLYFPPNAKHSIETEQLNCKKTHLLTIANFKLSCILCKTVKDLKAGMSNSKHCFAAHEVLTTKNMSAGHSLKFTTPFATLFCNYLEKK